MRVDLRLLSFPDLIKVMDLGLLRDLLIKRFPETLYSYLEVDHNRASRQADRGLVKVKIIPKTEKFRRTFLFRAVSTWNRLPNDFKDLTQKKYEFQDDIKRFYLGDFDGPGSPRPPPPPRSNSTPFPEQRLDSFL